MSRIHYKRYSGIISLARNLRKNSTPSEKLLWEVLRRRQFKGFKFLRQHPVFYSIDKGWTDFYVADFYCAKLQLIIELDGPIHDKQKEKDIERDEKLNTRGFVVKRIRNEELSDINNVIAIINNIIEVSKPK